MEQPKDKAATLEQVRATHAELVTALERFSPDEMTTPGVNGEWSIKDMVAHIVWWEQHLLRRLRSGRDDVYEGVTDATEGRRRTDEVNARVLAENQSRPLADALADFRASYDETLAYLEAMTEDDLAKPEIAEPVGFDTYEHYPEHTHMLSDWRNTLGIEMRGDNP